MSLPAAAPDRICRDPHFLSRGAPAGRADEPAQGGLTLLVPQTYMRLASGQATPESPVLQYVLNELVQEAILLPLGKVSKLNDH